MVGQLRATPPAERGAAHRLQHAGILLAILLLLATSGSIGLALKPATPPPIADACAADAMADECERWDALWQELEHDGVEALAVTVESPDLRPAGDTCGMRYRNLFRHAATTAHFKMRLAAFSNEPAQKLALLDELTLAEDAVTRFRAGVETARIALRKGEPAAALALIAALDVEGVPAACQADAHFVAASAAIQLDDLAAAEAALERAVDADAGFWNARRVQTEVLSRLLVQRRQDPAACLARTRRIIENLGALTSLANDLRQLRDLASNADRQWSRTNPALMLMATLGYRWAGDPERAEVARAAIVTNTGRLPQACEALIIQRAQAMRGERS